MLASEIYDFIDSLAPFGTQDSFDNAGFLVGSPEKDVKKVAVCLDITNDIVDECAEKGVDLIVSHHPVIFTRIRSLDGTNPVYRLIKHDIAALCAHTNLDMARGGISDIMFSLMGFGSSEKAPVLNLIHKGEGLGYGRIAELSEPMLPEALAEAAKKAFNCNSVKYCSGRRPVRTVAVCSGAGNDEVYNCIKQNIDALITGDVKHHGFVDAYNSGLTVIDAGHYCTENIVCGMLLGKLQERFPEAEFFIPEANGEICRYI